jgi:hypothetical protein
LSGGQILLVPPESEDRSGPQAATRMETEIDPRYKRFYLLDNQRGSISLFTCPVEGCNFQTDQGPGALRMHMIISADPNCKGRHCKEHEKYVVEHPETRSQDWVHYLAKFPSRLHSDAEIGRIRE